MSTSALLTIPHSMTDSHREQPDCKLLSLSGELLQIIINDDELTIFDHACLMLSCKQFASLVHAFRGDLTVTGGLLTGLESEKLDMLEHALEDPNDEEELEQFEADFRKRTDPNILARFYRRLDYGWNRSASQWCHDCGMFRSTDRSYWNRKAEIYANKKMGIIAKRWRTMIDCGCDCNPDDYVDAWISHFEQKANNDSNKVKVTAQDSSSSRRSAKFWYIHCPECALLGPTSSDCVHCWKCRGNYCCECPGCDCHGC